MSAPLAVLLAGRVAGAIEAGPNQRHRFTYDPAWRAQPGAYPVSLSLPLAVDRHEGAVVLNFLWGLLPDNADVLAQLGRQHGVSARNPLALLHCVGEDCAGAIQLVAPDRIGVVSTDGPVADAERDVVWLSEAEVADRLRELRVSAATGRRPGDIGHFSLAGAQAKTALFRRGDRYGVPAGRTPTTHILKPPSATFDGFAENEHVCLELARALGVPTALSSVERFENEVAIVVERYDRQWIDGGLVRVHQEDFCQALGHSPATKYEAEGGPGARDIATLIRQHWQPDDVKDDLGVFLRALGLNWIIGGTDAHAKNYSLLHAVGPQVRLAPLYDLISALPHYPLDVPRQRLAMQIGGTYRLAQVGPRQWRKLAADLKLEPALFIAELHDLAARVPDALATVVARARASGLKHKLLARLQELIAARARRCAHVLTLSPDAARGLE